MKSPRSEGQLANADGFIKSLSLRRESGAVLLDSSYEYGLFRPDLFQQLAVEAPKNADQMAPRRLADFLAGRVLGRLAVRELADCEVQLPIGEDGAPAWPKGIIGSISHSHGFCCCLASNIETTALGVDLERIVDDRGAQAIQSVCLSQSERAFLCRQGDGMPLVLMTLIFSAKETIFKAYARVIGRHFGFGSIQLVGLSEDKVLEFEFVGANLYPIEVGHRVFVNYELRENFVRTWHFAA